MNQASHLLDLTDVFIATTDVKEVTLSHRLFGDSKKLTAIRAGADITVSRFNTALLWFAANWPEGAEWPENVSRPEAVEPLRTVG